MDIPVEAAINFAWYIQDVRPLWASLVELVTKARKTPDAFGLHYALRRRASSETQIADANPYRGSPKSWCLHHDRLERISFRSA